MPIMSQDAASPAPGNIELHPKCVDVWRGKKSSFFTWLVKPQDNVQRDCVCADNVCNQAHRGAFLAPQGDESEVK